MAVQQLTLYVDAERACITWGGVRPGSLRLDAMSARLLARRVTDMADSLDGLYGPFGVETIKTEGGL